MSHKMKNSHDFEILKQDFIFNFGLSQLTVPIFDLENTKVYIVGSYFSNTTNSDLFLLTHFFSFHDHISVSMLSEFEMEKRLEFI